MGRRKRTRLLAGAARRAALIAAELGAQVRQRRRRRGWTQRALGARIGLHHSRISQVELGEGGSLTLRDWTALADALDAELFIKLSRDREDEPADAGHLRMQELLLRLGREAGVARLFELPTRPADPTRSVDVGLRDHHRRTLILLEAWNTIADIGAAARSTARKLAEAQALATALGGDEGPYRVAGCWVVRSSRGNRDLLARYPEVFAARFPGSSAGWARAISSGTEPPDEPGLVWCDPSRGTVFAWRRR
jgi:transcriptional regulator with XRE-family HTH domain